MSTPWDAATRHSSEQFDSWPASRTDTRARLRPHPIPLTPSPRAALHAPHLCLHAYTRAGSRRAQLAAQFT